MAASGRGAAASADSFQLSKSSHLTKAEEYATFQRPMGYKSGAIFRFDQPDSEANIAFEPDGQLKAGTFAKIVEKMTGKNAGSYTAIVPQPTAGQLVLIALSFPSRFLE